MLRTASSRLLDDADLAALKRLLADDPIGNCSVAGRVEAYGAAPHRLGAQLWGTYGWGAPARLVAGCYVGANLVPFGRDAAETFAERARRDGRRCSSIVGRSELVAPLWQRLCQHWGPAREIRPAQPLLAIAAPPALDPDPQVRRVTAEELELLMPAAIAMFTEEVGVSPLGSDNGALYRARMRQLVAAGRCFARIERGRVIFKADLGAVSPGAAQVQGVWVDPALRGRGIGTAGTAAVVAATLGSVAPVVSLYVNDYNTAARAAYRRVGFQQVGTFMSVLF
ncbi:MAG: GNAT family N-acetyltransferase [Mycobacteriales bacterium]